MQGKKWQGRWAWPGPPLCLKLPALAASTVLHALCPPLPLTNPTHMHSPPEVPAHTDSSGTLLSPPTEHSLHAGRCDKCFTFAVPFCPKDAIRWVPPPLTSFLRRGNQGWRVVSNRAQLCSTVPSPLPEEPSQRAVRSAQRAPLWNELCISPFFLKVSEQVNKDRYVI